MFLKSVLFTLFVDLSYQVADLGVIGLVQIRIGFLQFLQETFLIKPDAVVVKEEFEEHHADIDEILIAFHDGLDFVLLQLEISIELTVDTQKQRVLLVFESVESDILLFSLIIEIHLTIKDLKMGKELVLNTLFIGKVVDSEYLQEQFEILVEVVVFNERSVGESFGASDCQGDQKLLGIHTMSDVGQRWEEQTLLEEAIQVRQLVKCFQGAYTGAGYFGVGGREVQVDLLGEEQERQTRRDAHRLVMGRGERRQFVGEEARAEGGMKGVGGSVSQVGQVELAAQEYQQLLLEQQVDDQGGVLFGDVDGVVVHSHLVIGSEGSQDCDEGVVLDGVDGELGHLGHWVRRVEQETVTVGFGDVGQKEEGVTRKEYRKTLQHQSVQRESLLLLVVEPSVRVDQRGGTQRLQTSAVQRVVRQTVQVFRVQYVPGIATGHGAQVQCLQGQGVALRWERQEQRFVNQSHLAGLFHLGLCLLLIFVEWLGGGCLDGQDVERVESESCEECEDAVIRWGAEEELGQSQQGVWVAGRLVDQLHNTLRQLDVCQVRVLLLFNEPGVQDVQGLLPPITVHDLRLLHFQTRVYHHRGLVTLQNVTTHGGESDEYQVVVQEGVDDGRCFRRQGVQVQIWRWGLVGLVQTRLVVVLVVGQVEGVVADQVVVEREPGQQKGLEWRRGRPDQDLEVTLVGTPDQLIWAQEQLQDQEPDLIGGVMGEFKGGGTSLDRDGGVGQQTQLVLQKGTGGGRGRSSQEACQGRVLSSHQAPEQT